MDDLKKILGYVGCASVLLIFMAVVFVWIGFNRGEKSKFQGNNSGSGSNCSILFPAGAGSDEDIAKALNSWMASKNANSPLKDKGLVFAQSGRGSNINPALMVAIALKESSLGTKVPADSYNPFGRTATDDQPGVVINGRRWYKFSDPDGEKGPLDAWDASIIAQGPYMQSRYVAQEGITTLGALINKYAPPSENDTNTYIAQMRGWINDMTGLASGALGKECVEATVAEGPIGELGQCNVGYTGSPATCGWIEVPVKPDIYSIYGDQGEHWGTSKLVNMVMSVAQKWKSAGKPQLAVGEISGKCTKAEGHEDHANGADIDLDCQNCMKKDGTNDNPNYNPQLAIDLAKLLISCGTQVIGYQDDNVNNTVNAWAKQNGYSGYMVNWHDGLHFNHFHVQMK